MLDIVDLMSRWYMKSLLVPYLHEQRPLLGGADHNGAILLGSSAEIRNDLFDGTVWDVFVHRVPASSTYFP